MDFFPGRGGGREGEEAGKMMKRRKWAGCFHAHTYTHDERDARTRPLRSERGLSDPGTFFFFYFDFSLHPIV